MRGITTTCSALCIALALAQPLAAQSLRVNFEALPAGPLSESALSRLWPGIEWATIERVQIASDSQPQQGRILQVLYPRGSVGPAQGGAQFLAKLPPAAEYWLSYRVRFEPDFDFSRGGKLPGLTSGGSKFTGGTRPANGEGWSARYMWGPAGAARVYLYHVDMPGEYGDGIVLPDVTFVPGQWHRLTQHIRVNTPDGADGLMEISFDGKQVLQRSDIRYRIGQQGLIDSFYFSTFHGGNTPDWAPAVDSVASFDDFLISAVDPGNAAPPGAPASAAAVTDRAWKLANGAELHGRVVEFNPRTRTVNFRRTSGTVLRGLPLTRFSETDQAAILAMPSQ